MSFEGIKTKHVDMEFLNRNRTVFTPLKLLKRRNFEHFCQPSRPDMILDAAFCREKCQELYFTPKKRK